ncbi:MAG TPA: penicillin acylase family protein [Pyrinomonadaceae bacterium]|nr:penicillin acylase family protein [Acidobacteriota bacterium]HQZ96333.1 penicillin acylase family protein [Pyrinomonadaceae bacterium]
MKKYVHVLVLLVLLTVSAASQAPSERQRWEAQAKNITITRDDWGIAHVKGKTDADAVFGAIYAQAEDDFNRIETNYLNSIGRLAEAEGERAIWSDLRQKLFIDEQEMKRLYFESPEWLRKLMNAWADGLNFYLATHPNVKPRVIAKFEPWMPLTFSEGSIGGDIESIDLGQLRQFYDQKGFVAVKEPEDPLKEPSGSNGIAISPSITKNKKALLLINPHTSFFFRSELQMTSDEGLNAYGASTWGQFFIYQGFNERLGWMHTSSEVDAIDEWLETVVKKEDGTFAYIQGGRERKVTGREIAIKFKAAGGAMTERKFTALFTHHGPIVRSEGAKLVSVGLMNEPVKALMQSYGRTKAKNYNEFKKVMELQANSSNATLYADADGNNAYFHPNFVPRRDPKFDWTKPVDGSDPATDWKGLLSFNELPNIKNPASGWVYNSNNWPWSAAGPSSLKQADFPKYVDNGVESARGRHAIRVLKDKKDFTLESLNAAAYDSYMPWFETTLPALTKAWDALPSSDPTKAALAEQIALLKNWDLRWSVNSVPTSLGVFWADDLVRSVGMSARQSGMGLEEYIATKAAPDQLLRSLAAASDRLKADFGSWKTAWGEINRFQRLTDDIVHPFNDAAPSIPVGFASGNLGSLASFGARPFRGSKKWYGTSGNSFVAVVEFGKTVRAKAVTAGGESGDPKSKHFNDQAERYSTGNLREVYFYPAQLKGKIERQYQPGK